MTIISWLQNMIIDNKIESIFIESMDNPGWSIKIDENDNLESSIDCKKEDIRSEDDWISVSFNNTSYTLMGGANNLIELLVTIQKTISPNGKAILVPETEKLLKWLELWFSFNSNGEWEHGYAMYIINKGSNWEVKIDLCNMAFALDGMPLFEKRTNSSDYFKYIIEDEYFIGEASNGNLEKLLKAFKTIVTKNEKRDGYIDEFYQVKEFTKLQKKYREGLDNNIK